MKLLQFFSSNLRKLSRVSLSLTLLFMLVPAASSALGSHLFATTPTTQTTTTTPPADQTHAQANNCKTVDFFGLEPWYQYLNKEFAPGTGTQGCDLKCFNLLPLQDGKANDCGQSSSDVPLVLLAVIDDLLRISGMVAVAFVIFGGFKYVSSQGDPDGTSKAQGTLVNALIGMAVATVALVIVSFIGNAVG